MYALPAFDVTARGINRAAIFLDDEDRHPPRRLMRKAYSTYRVSGHAFVLIDNHVHLLPTPQTAASLTLAIRVSRQSYLHAFKARH